MRYLVPESMPVDITEALSSRFRSKLGQERSRYAQPSRTEQTEARELMSALEGTVIRAMAAADSSLRLGQNVGLAIVSGEGEANYTLHGEEVRILSPRASRSVLRILLPYCVAKRESPYGLMESWARLPTVILGALPLQLNVRIASRSAWI